MDGGQLIQVILPLKLEWLPTYRSVVPCHTGQRVIARMGRREYIGVVCRTDVQTDIAASRIQNIITTDTGLPDILPSEIALWEFVSSYYMCTPGEVYKAAYPALKTQSEEVSAAILERLQTRLSKREAALQKKHNATVTERLVRERDEIAAQIEAIRRGRTLSEGAVKPSAGKPQVIVGPDRYSTFIRKVKEALDCGCQVLVLTPEIAFCDSLEQRLRPIFGDSLKIFNSTRTAVQRRHVADDIRSGAPAVVLGTRSALFLPFRSLSLIIVDDEQDSSYKQTEPAPRYNGRDVALALGSIHKAQVILGTDSPSLETVLNCRTGKYSAVSVGQSMDSLSCEIIDIPAERRKRGMHGCLSFKLIEAVRNTRGPVVLIRRWERREELEAELKALFGGQDVRTMTLSELKSNGTGGAELIGIIQADALVSKDDFRADERAAQLVTMLRSMAPDVVIQTAVPERFTAQRSTDELLSERREFGFPPYTRLVEVRRSGTSEVVSRHFLRKDSSLAEEKKKIAASLPDGCYIDADPI